MAIYRESKNDDQRVEVPVLGRQDTWPDRPGVWEGHVMSLLRALLQAGVTGGGGQDMGRDVEKEGEGPGS